MSGGPGSPADEESFQGLLRSLTVVHEQQHRAIRELREENALLRERLKLLGGSDLDGGSIKIELTANVKPPEAHEGDVEAPMELQTAPRRGSIASSHSCPSASAQTSLASSIAWPVPSLWLEWLKPAQDGEPNRVLTRNSMSQLLLIEDTTGQAMTVVNRCYQVLILRPNSCIRLTWDFFSTFMVLYDIISIPLMAVTLRHTTDAIMDGGTGPFTDVMDWVTTIFWTVDIPWSFLTGYNCDGVVEMRAYQISRHYLRTWFPFDFGLIVIDWSIVYASIVAGRGAHMLGLFRIGKTARMARILRTVRLLRFVKLQRVLCECLELINSEYIRAVFNVTLAVAFIFVINHYLACGWFLVGHICWTADMPNWISSNGIQDTTITYAYFTSLHWSLTQFTPASMEIRPYNLVERIYSILCLLFALITFSSFLGSITASISQLRKHSTECGKQQFILRTYFTKNKVSSSLSKTIWYFLKQHHFSQMTRSHKAHIEVLKLLPPHLQGMLNQELYSPYITRAPFFYHYAAFSSEGLVELCTKAISERTLICGEILFTTGKVAEKMFFAASGFLRYEHPTGPCSQTIGTGAWIAEPVLWVKWVHVAPLIADTSSEIIALDAAAFRQIMPSFKRSLPFVKVYAQLFHAYLENQGQQQMTDLLTDVHRLEGLTREAWYAVTSTKDRSIFKDMPNPQFPRSSTRQKRVKRLMWGRETPIHLPGFIKDGWKRTSRGSWA